MSSSVVRIALACAMIASISTSFAAASVFHRAEGVDGGKTATRRPVSAMLKPSLRAWRTIANRARASSAYSRRPLTRRGAGSSPTFS
jgi:hypothetical protein